MVMDKTRRITNILVTGGAGFIGSAFIRYLLTKVPYFHGKCINLDLLTYAGNLDNLQLVANDPRYLFQRGDINNQALVEHLCFEYNVDTIIHFAAESHVDRSIHNPQAFIETNVLGTFRLLEVVRKNPHIHFHHVSTDEVYGCLGEEGCFSETSPYHPNSPYSASKASSDHFVRAYSKTYNISTCISNCSNNYGPYHFPEKMIPLMIKNCLDDKPLPIYGDGSNVRDWLFVEDHAEALWMLLENAKRGETYNIGGESEFSNLSVVTKIIAILAELTNDNIERFEKLITYIKDRPGHDFRYAIDCSKIKNEIGWQPEHSFDEGLRKTIAWYLENQNWMQKISDGSYQNWIQFNYSERQ